MIWPILSLLFLAIAVINPASSAANVDTEWSNVPNHPAVNYKVQWTMGEPFETLQGTYHLDEVNIAEFPPVLATVWAPLGDFKVVVWPPKHCHAVHVCFIPRKEMEVGMLHIRPEYCQKNFVRIYPHSGEIQIHPGNSSTIKGFNQMTSVRFSKINGGVTVEYTEKHHVRRDEWLKEPRKTATIANADEMHILLLTNSRYCYAHMSQSGRSQVFRTPLHPKRFVNFNQLPLYFTTFAHPDGEYTIFKPLITASSTKKFDLLTIVKDYAKKLLNLQSLHQSNTCSSFRTKSLNPLKHSIGLITADSWIAQQSAASATQYTDSFQIRIGKCSWMRIWFSEATESFTEYYDKMHLKNTIDFFFDQQFMVGPDSDEARPLHGDSSQIGTVQIKRMPVTAKTNPEKVLEVSYGRDNGPGFPFKEYFHLESISAVTSFGLNIIKAPECEAVLVPGALDYRFYSATRAQFNRLGFKDCKHFVLEAEKRLEEDHENYGDYLPRYLKE